MCSEGLGYLVRALQALPTECVLYRPCLLGVCYAGFLLCKPSAYLVCVLKALATWCVLCRPWLLGLCSEGPAYWHGHPQLFWKGGGGGGGGARIGQGSAI